MPRLFLNSAPPQRAKTTCGGEPENSKPLFVKLLEAIIRRLDISFRTAAIEALALELVGQHATTLSLLKEGIGNLDFAALARLSLGDQLKNIRCQNIPANDR